MRHTEKEYNASCGRGTGNERVICIRLNSKQDILDSSNNVILDALSSTGMGNAIGLYFYRFQDTSIPFIKIGECTRTEGIRLRFQRGWHYSHTCADTYQKKKTEGKYVDSKFYTEICKISAKKPAYFVFYEHKVTDSYPKIDEIYAFHLHNKHYNVKSTLSPERVNGNHSLGINLIWHKEAFSEVLSGKFPCGSPY